MPCSTRLEEYTVTNVGCLEGTIAMFSLEHVPDVHQQGGQAMIVGVGLTQSSRIVESSLSMACFVVVQ